MGISIGASAIALCFLIIAFLYTGAVFVSLFFGIALLIIGTEIFVDGKKNAINTWKRYNG
ncbi:MAG: hypothetical protein WA364_19715 [Candidatus Nitrosopolaris sp.]